MAAAGGAAAASAAMHSSSYRVKFKKREFLELVEIARAESINHVRRMHFFSYERFVMYTFECDRQDFAQRVIDAIEFSNPQWDE